MAELKSERSAPSRRQTRRELGIAVIFAVLGGALVLWASTRSWAGELLDRRYPLPDQHSQLTGKDIAAWASAMGFVGLAGGVALIATKAWGRWVVGALLVAAGALAIAGGVVGLTASPDTPHKTLSIHPAWPVVTALGGVLALAAGAITVLRHGSWRRSAVGMSERYDSPSARSTPERSARIADSGATAPAALWDALDRGEDPTAS